MSVYSGGGIGSAGTRERRKEEGRAEGARKRLIGQAIMANAYEGGEPGKGHVESRPALKCRGAKKKQLR